MADSTPQAPSVWRARLIAFGVGLLIGGVGAGAVYLDARAAHSSMRGQLDKMQAREALLRAQSLLADAADALEDDNYGSARDLAEAAKQQLHSVDPGAASLDDEELSLAQEQLDSVTIATGGAQQAAAQLDQSRATIGLLYLLAI